MGSLIGSSFRNALAMDLNGTNQYGWVDNPTFKTNTSGCFSFWFKLDALFTSNVAQTIIGYGVNSGSNDSLILIGPRRTTATGTGTFMNFLTRTTNGGTFTGYSATTTPLVAGVWMYCEIESNGSATSVRINNVSQTLTKWYGTGLNDAGDWLGDISGSDHKFLIGNHWTANVLASGYFAGVVDEINYFDRTLTGPESLLLYNAGVPRNPYRAELGSAWKSWWRCGDSRDTNAILYDEIGTNNITLVNTPTFVTP